MDHLRAVMHGWFVVLPDSALGGSVASAFSARAPRFVRYPSGRLWIVGQWAPEDVIFAIAGSACVAIIGSCSADATELSTLIKNVRTVADFDQLARRLPGSFHLIASVDGETRIQGSLSAIRQVSYTEVDHAMIAADNSYTLASTVGAIVDDDILALRMAYPVLPYPMDDQPMWKNVYNLPSDCYLVINREGHARTRRWWLAPEPVLPLADGAVAVRRALDKAVAVRTASGGVISADLSGGMDSTSLCFLAAPGKADLITARRVEADPGSDDDVWARRAAAKISAEHLVFTHGEAPMIYADVGDVEEFFDSPYRWISSRNEISYPLGGNSEPLTCNDANFGGFVVSFRLLRTRGRHRHLVNLLAERGSRQHLTGHGGDEIFGVFPSYLHALMRTDPTIAVKHLHGFRALRRWSWRDTIHALADRATFVEWLATSAERLAASPPPPTMPHFGWGWPVRMPVWATSGAVEAARDLFRNIVARMPDPLAELRAQHEVLQYVRACGRSVRQVAVLASNVHTRITAPYLDDRVIEAALAVCLHERMTPWKYKPLLAAAMRGVTPDEILRRTTKGDFTADVYAGVKQHRASLLELFVDSALAQRGLIDVDTLRDSIVGIHPTFATLIPLEQTVACETWLRAVANMRCH